MKYKVRVVTPPATGLAITRIMEVRRLDIKGINSLADARRFVMDGVPAILDEKDSDRVVPIVGGENVVVDIYSTFVAPETNVPSNVEKGLTRFGKALEWYKNLSSDDKEKADLIIDVYSKLINDMDVTDLVDR